MTEPHKLAVEAAKEIAQGIADTTEHHRVLDYAPEIITRACLLHETQALLTELAQANERALEFVRRLG